MICAQCGAALEPMAEACAFCHTTTAYGAQVAAQRQAQAQIAAVQAQRMSYAVAWQQDVRARSAATWALVTGILSVFLWFLLLPPLIGLGLYARAVAVGSTRRGKFPRAHVGGALSLLSGIAGIAVWTYIFGGIHRDDVALDARKKELTHKIGSHLSEQKLAPPTACAAAELYVLDEGYKGDTNTGSFRDIRCLGKLDVGTDRAVLHDLQLRTSETDPKVKVDVCFKHGAAWFVDGVGDSGKCPVNAQVP
jgi:hypothetical protein